MDPLANDENELQDNVRSSIIYSKKEELIHNLSYDHHGEFAADLDYFSIAKDQYSDTEASMFKVRGANYLKDNVKITPKGKPLFKLIACDLFDTGEVRSFYWLFTHIKNSWSNIVTESK